MQHATAVQRERSNRGRLVAFGALTLGELFLTSYAFNFPTGLPEWINPVTLAKASAERAKANRADIEGIVTRTLDSASFNAWFTAFTAGNAKAQRLAEKRMRPGYRPSFNAWQATDPAHNPDAPPGPAYMPQYVIPQDAVAKASDDEADAAFAEGAEAGATADKYIRATVFLATVLFLVGISGHFPIRAARVGLICAGGSILIFAVIQLLGLPGPPA